MHPSFSVAALAARRSRQTQPEILPALLRLVSSLSLISGGLARTHHQLPVSEYSKAQNTEIGDVERGDQFTYLSMDKDSKLIINWRVGKRNGENTLAFMQDLKSRMASRFQLTTDAFNGYRIGRGSVREVFGNEIDYSTEEKIWAKPDLAGVSRWYNPLVVVGIKRKRRIGNADLSEATTCHAERMNLSLRIFSRRFTRKTLGYSKKLENLRHAVAIFTAHFNFIRKHSAHGMTPAQAAKLTDRQWTIEEMLTP